MRKIILAMVAFTLLCASCEKEHKKYILAIYTTFDRNVDGTAIDIYAVDDSSAYRMAFREFLDFVGEAYCADTTLNPFDFEIHLCGPDAKPVYDIDLRAENRYWKAEMIETYCSEEMKRKMAYLVETQKHPGTAYSYWR